MTTGMENTISGLIISIVTLALGWLVGHRLTVSWALRQKWRELEISALSDFYRLYGEFFAIWKSWAYCCNPRDKNMKVPVTAQVDLLDRACTAEGAVEAMFVKLSCERTLLPIDIEVLGKYRQSYQSLRESIREGRDINWWSHDQAEYLSFKRLAFLTACIIVSDKPKSGVGDSLERITSNIWEDNWILEDSDWKKLRQYYTKDKL